MYMLTKKMSILFHRNYLLLLSFHFNCCSGLMDKAFFRNLWGHQLCAWHKVDSRLARQARSKARPVGGEIENPQNRYRF